MSKYVSTKSKSCETCKRKFVPTGNRQTKCAAHRTNLKQLPIRPTKDPVDRMLDEAEFSRRSARAKDGWY